jgi:hypothetical protein
MASAAQRLALGLFTLEAGRNKLVWFHPKMDPRLAIFEDDGEGRKGLEALRARTAERPGGSSALVGLLTAEPTGEPVLAAPGADERVLKAVARFVAARHKALPSLAALVDLGVQDSPIDPLDPVSLQGWKPVGAIRRPELWAGLKASSAGGLSKVLRSRRPGQSCWFRLSLGGEGVPLVMQPVEHDASGQLTRAQAEGLSGHVAGGIATLTDAGTWQFRSVDATPGHLKALADWVRTTVGEHPSLARLSGASIAHVGPGGRIDRVSASAALWVGIPSPAIPGTLQASLSALRKLPLGEDAWLWANHSAADGPGLLLIPQRSDADGAEFDRLRRAATRRFTQTVSASDGVLTKVSEDRVIICCRPEAVRSLTHALAAVVDAEPELAQGLENAQVVGQNEGAATFLADVQAVLLLRRAAADLPFFEGEEDLYFWFVSRDRDGQPTLAISDDLDALKAGVARWSAGLPADRTLRGRVTLAEDGALRLQARRLPAGGLRALAAVVARDAATIPGLHVLRGCELARVDKAGTVLGQQRDPALWTEGLP